jgi:uncharacterized protein (TIGR00730 family)
LASRGIGLVYGGGRVGLMGEIANAVLDADGEVIGVLPEALERRELGHQGLSDLRIVGSMHERKAMMAELSDAFVALPGGLGTLEEIIEVATWTQLCLHAKPIGLLDVRDYWTDLERLLDHAVREGFLRPDHRELLLSDRSAELLLDRLAAWRPPAPEMWLDGAETPSSAALLPRGPSLT